MMKEPFMEAPAREGKTFVSAENISPRMFRSNWLDYLSRVKPWVPTAIFGPVVVACMAWHYLHVPRFWPGLALFAGGLAAWSLFEYALHRWVFHFKPQSALGQRVYFIIHGVHHDYPNDKLRLVMPPGVSVPLGLAIFSLSLLAGGLVNGPMFFAGFTLGYLIYDNLHYAVHHFNFKNRWFQQLKRHHMMHHFRDPNRGFGFTSPFWDKIFGTDYD